MIRLSRGKRSISSSEAEVRGRGKRKKINKREDENLEFSSDEEDGGSVVSQNLSSSNVTIPSTSREYLKSAPVFPTLLNTHEETPREIPVTDSSAKQFAHPSPTALPLQNQPTQEKVKKNK